jgi:hypothetical protein
MNPLQASLKNITFYTSQAATFIHNEVFFMPFLRKPGIFMNVCIPGNNLVFLDAQNYSFQIWLCKL